MLELLQFIFSSFWVWAGAIILIVSIGWALNAFMVGIRGHGAHISFL